MSIAALSTSEEIEKWRRQQMNNGEENSPMLSHHRDLSPKKSVEKGMQNFYVTLAKESPQRVNEESDASTYDISFHCRETDVCRDSSDTESNSTYTIDGFAAMEVLEYEVRSASASEDLYSNNSSSGSDEEFLLAAVAAEAIYQSSTSCSSAFADTEESATDNSSYDSELSTRDYWRCVKCKNKQNNPMFRYCEKCYQIRKDHFPPRPRQWKSRSKKGRKESFRSSRIRNAEFKTSNCCQNDSVNIPSEAASHLSICDNISKNQKSNNFFSTFRRKYRKSGNKSPLSSSTNTSSDEDWDEPYVKKFSTVKRRRKISEMNGDKLSTNASNSNMSSLISTTLSSGEIRKRKLSSSEINGQPLKVSKSGSEPELDVVYNQVQLLKDSGVSSAPPSSQEVHSCFLSDENPNPGKTDTGQYSSDDTVCEELDAQTIDDLKKFTKANSDESDGTRHSDRIPSDLSSMASTCSPLPAASTLIKSLSEYTEQVNIRPKAVSDSKSLIDNFELSAYGLCIVCLSEPKNGVFVHSKFVHLCCCYKCAVKVWNKSKRCPVCNCAVKNVMKLFVH